MLATRFVLLALSGAILLFSGSPKALAAYPPPAVGKDAMVVSAHPLASQAGREILEKGGNIIDAAIAVSLALSVVEPWSSGLGGGAFAVVKMGDKLESYDMRETAPGKAKPDMFLKDGEIIPKLSTKSALSAGIPGMVRGLALLHKDHGSLPFSELVLPALRLARDGFLVSQHFSQQVASQKDSFNDAAKAIFLPNGRPPEAQERFYQKDLAKVLERIGKTQGEDFYTGETAKDLLSGVQALGGIWEKSDLSGYEVKKRKPVSWTFRGYELASMPPPSSGGYLLLQMTRIIEALPFTRAAGLSRFHQSAEIMKRAYAMRALGLADPDFYPVDEEHFIGDATIKRLIHEVSQAKTATPAESLSSLKVQDERPDTSHFAIMDRKGNGIAMTQTINLFFGAALVVPKTGIFLNDEMDDFAVKVGAPNAFGLLGDKANQVEAKKRPLSSMTPTLVLKDKDVVGAFGSPGGSRIITTTLQVLEHVIDDHFDVSEAVSAPRIHHQWYPDEIQYEKHALSPETREALMALGHKLKLVPYMGNAMAIWRRADGSLEGAADPRGEGKAIGFSRSSPLSKD